MPPARPSWLKVLLVSLLAAALPAGADVGGSISVQTDARDRGMSYSDNQPSAQAGLAWDGDGGWYGGGQLAHARFTDRRGAWLQVYGGRVFGLSPGIDGEVGLAAHAFENVSRYDYQEAYVGLLGEGWQLRAYFSPDYYGISQRSGYVELNLRRALGPGWAVIGHVGLLRRLGGQLSPYAAARNTSRLDLRLGASWQLGDASELQLVWVAAGRGGLYTWTDASRRRTALLSLTTTF